MLVPQLILLGFLPALFLFLFLPAPVAFSFLAFWLHHASFLFVKVKMKPPPALQTHFDLMLSY